MFFGIPIAFAIAILLIGGGVGHHDVQERQIVQIELAKQNKYCAKFDLNNECVKEEEKINESKKTDI